MALKYTGDPAHDVKGWFDPMLTLAGWYDDELTETAAVPPTTVPWRTLVGVGLALLVALGAGLVVAG
jgi:hypothetical protein